MPITLIGTPQSEGAANGGNVALTFDVAPTENDVVILIGGHADNDSVGAPGATGYTEFLAPLETNNMAVGAFYKVMGATPDTTVVGLGDGVTSHGTAYAAYVLRGVDTTTVPDATPTNTVETVSTNPDTPSITTVTDGAWVFSLWGATNSVVGEFTPTAPTGYSELATAFGSDTLSFGIVASLKEVATAGAEDPGAYTDSITRTYNGITLAVRPAGAAAEPEAAAELAAWYIPLLACIALMVGK